MPTFKQLGLDLEELPGVLNIVEPEVEGVPTHVYAETHKDDLGVMLLCCDAEERANIKTGQFPAPFFFERAAILAGKSGDKRLDIAVCLRFARCVERSREFMKQSKVQMADVSQGPRGQAILRRLKKNRGGA